VKKNKKYTESNRKAWNQAMPRHQKVMKKKWDKRFQENNYVLQKGIELEKLNEIDINDKDVAHLCCNNGVELLSLKNMGAGRCVGFDISDKAIKEARERADKTGINCEYVRTDVLNIDKKYYNSFDLIYITIGALVWLPDLNKFFSNANKLLRKDGRVFIYEQHPFAEVFPWWEGEGENNLTAIHSYFDKKPDISTEGIDYIGGTTYNSHPSYEFTHTLSEIFMGLIDNGINIQYFKEYSHDISNVYTHLIDDKVKLPLSYILIGEKTN